MRTHDDVSTGSDSTLPSVPLPKAYSPLPNMRARDSLTALELDFQAM